MVKTRRIHALICALSLWHAPAFAAALNPDIMCAADVPPFEQRVDPGLNQRLVRAIEQRDYDEAYFLIDSGAIPDEKARQLPFIKKIENDLLLLDSARTRDIAGIKRALKNGADPNVQLPADLPWPALLIASYCGYKDVAEVMVEHGADVNMGIQDAISREHLDIAEMLLEKGADPNDMGADKKANPPLTLVKSKEAACLLLRYGADPNLIDQYGRTPLTVAIDKIEVVKVLLGAGADVNLEFRKGMSVLGLVHKIEDPEVRKVILNHKKYENKNECRPK